MSGPGGAEEGGDSEGKQGDEEEEADEEGLGTKEGKEDFSIKKWGSRRGQERSYSEERERKSLEKAREGWRERMVGWQSVQFTGPGSVLRLPANQLGSFPLVLLTAHWPMKAGLYSQFQLVAHTTERRAVYLSISFTH